MNLILTADGGSRGNPGPSAYGFAIWIIDETNLLIKDRVQEIVLQETPHFTQGKYIGNTTNNQAEWQGVLAGLEYIQGNLSHFSNLFIALDSELVIKQLTGQYKVKNPGLIPLHRQAMSILKEFNNYSLNHIYRQYNKIADGLVNEALDNI